LPHVVAVGGWEFECTEQALRERLAQQLLQPRNRRRPKGPVGPLDRIVGQLLVALAPEDPASRLVAEPVRLIEVEDPVRYRVIVTGRFLQAPCPQDQDIESGEVDRAEGRRAWSAQ